MDFQLNKSHPSHAWVVEQSEPGVSARSLVDNQFGALKALLDDSSAEFSASLQRMRDALVPISVADIPTSDATIPTGLDIIPTFSESFSENFLDTVEDFTFSYTMPSGRPDPSSVEWEDGIVDLVPEVVAELAHWLTSGEPAMPAALVGQIYAAVMTEHDEKRLAEIIKLNADAAARGWECPAEVVAAQIAQLNADFAKASGKTAAEIAAKNNELTQQNFHKAAELALDYIKSQQLYYIERNKAKIQWYVSAVEAWSKAVDATIKELDAHITAYKAKVEAFQSKASVYKTKSEVFISKVQAYSAQIDGIKTRISAVLDTVKTEVEIFKTKAETQIAAESLKVDAQKSNQALAQRMAEAESSFYSNLATGALSAIHVQAGISAQHQTGQDVKYSYGWSEGIDEKRTDSESLQYNVSVKE